MVSVTEAVIIGVIQGILEWLPVSSEGNLSLFLVSFLGLEVTETLGLAVFLHIGTGFAALIYYRRIVYNILVGSTEQDRDMRLRLIVMTGLTGLVGLPIYLLLNVSVILGESLLVLTALALIVTGLMQRNRPNTGKRDQTSLNWPETIILGLLQGLAIIPGLSRSGITTTMLLIRDYKGNEAFNISFLMSIPASFAAGFGLLLIESFQPTSEALIAVIVSAIIGYITIDALLKIAEKTSFWKICVALGGATLFAYIPNFL
ncbi:MAG: undecaprenyl-diphosphate phosphatase [Candidatus Bathyarchaeota archaeon]|nr:undecaprenyl-diphosphate phosphatase [Candidatus Bathyarchaeota archaeon]